MFNGLRVEGLGVWRGFGFGALAAEDCFTALRLTHSSKGGDMHLYSQSTPLQQLHYCTSA